ncbi:hypothetical protein ACIQC9_10865 [Brevundimonas sp. NPDC092305]
MTMLNGFQSLLPKDDGVFKLFDPHAAILINRTRRRSLPVVGFCA